MRQRPTKPRRRGMTLAEVLVTLALLAVVLLALIPLFLFGVKVNVSSNQLGMANTLAREKLDELLMYPSTDRRLLIPDGTAIASFGNDLPLYYKPSTGEVAYTKPTAMAGWYPYPISRTYTVQAASNQALDTWANALKTDASATLSTLTASLAGHADESFYNAGTAAPYYAVKIVTVTVQPSAPGQLFPGLRRTVQTAYVRFRRAG